MSDDLSIFRNLPRRRRPVDDDDEDLPAWMLNFEPEGPMRPRPSGVGGPSIGQTPPPPPTVPVNTTAPVASGTATVGSTLSCTTGAWSNSPTSYAYQWQRGGVNIAGATSATYLTVSADGGTSVTCVVTGTNTAGNASATSNALAIAGAASSVWNAADAGANSVTLTNGGLTATYNGAVNLYVPVRSTVSKSSGKLYVEFLNVSPGNVDRYGFASASINVSTGLGASNYSAGIGWAGNPISSGFTSNYSVALWATPGHVISLAIDFTAGNIWIALDGVWSGADPATGTTPIISFVPATVGPLFPAIGWQQAGASYTLQPTAASQKYLPPVGFQAWDGGPVTPPPSTWNSADKSANITLSGGSLITTWNGSAGGVRSTSSKTSGKFYFEATLNVLNATVGIGLANSSLALTSFPNTVNNIYARMDGSAIQGNGSGSLGSTGGALSPPQTVGIAVDFGAQLFWYGLSATVWNGSSANNPATGVGGVSFSYLTGPFFVYSGAAAGSAGTQTTVNFGATAFSIPTPAGFSPWG